MRINVNNLILGVIWLALIMALLASMEHTAWGFATLNGGSMFWGYAQALAIDLGMAALALAIRQRKIAGKNSAALWCGVGLFCAVSIYANLLYGTAHAQAIVLQEGYEWATPLVWLRPILFSGVLPILVVYLLEVVGERSHYQVASKIAKPTREVATEVAQPTKGVATEVASEPKQAHNLSKEHRKDLLIDAVIKGHYSHRTIAAYSGISRGSISNLLAELKAENRIITTGNGRLTAAYEPLTEPLSSQSEPPTEPLGKPIESQAEE